MVLLKDALGVYAGSQLAKKVYAGNDLVWEGIKSFNANPIADTYVHAAAATTNFNVESTLYWDSGTVRIAYLQFDLTEMAGKTVTSAQLTAYLDNTSVETLGVYYLPQTIDYATVTYNTRPALTGAVLLGSFTDLSTLGWITADLTNFSGLPLGGVVNIMLRKTDAADSGVFRTIDWPGGAFKPKLTMIYT